VRRRGLDAPYPTTAPKNQAPELPEDIDSPETLRKQTERRAEAARQRLDAQIAYYEEERIPVGRWIDASRQLMLAETATGTTKEQRVAAAKAHFDRMTEAAAREERRLKDGRGNSPTSRKRYSPGRTPQPGTWRPASPEEVELLKRRVESLEWQLETVLKRLDHSGTDMR
jgi:hypothetical protein